MPPKKPKPLPVKSEPNPVGRPSAYAPEFCPMLLDHMEKGYSFEAFAGRVGVCRDTLYAWVERHVEFSDTKKVGLEKARLFWERLGMGGTTGNLKGFNATMWIFNMKNRFQWRDRHEVDANITMEPLIIELPMAGKSITLTTKEGNQD